jgi:hypothetical protein
LSVAVDNFTQFFFLFVCLLFVLLSTFFCSFVCMCLPCRSVFFLLFSLFHLLVVLYCAFKHLSLVRLFVSSYFIYFVRPFERFLKIFLLFILIYHLLFSRWFSYYILFSLVKLYFLSKQKCIYCLMFVFCSFSGEFF